MALPKEDCPYLLQHSPVVVLIILPVEKSLWDKYCCVVEFGVKLWVQLVLRRWWRSQKCIFTAFLQVSDPV